MAVACFACLFGRCCLCDHCSQLPEDVLAREIDALVLKDRITSDELKTLDAHLREVAAKLGGLTGIPEESSSDALDDLLTHIGSPAHDAPPGSFVPSLARHATEGAVWGSWSEHATTGSKTAASRTASARERDEWTVLAKYDEVVAFNAEQARKQETLKAKAEMREFLAQQMAQRSSTEAATSATEKNVWSKTFAVRAILYCTCSTAYEFVLHGFGLQAEVDAAAAEKLRLAEEKRLLGEQQKRTREQQIEVSLEHRVFWVLISPMMCVVCSVSSCTSRDGSSRAAGV